MELNGQSQAEKRLADVCAELISARFWLRRNPGDKVLAAKIRSLDDERAGLVHRRDQLRRVRR
jgi:hypothetical protein